MSFILDALKKSENERQQQGSAEFSTVPTSSGDPSPARWLWLLAVLLGVNLAVLVGILLRPDAEPDAAVEEPEQSVAAEPASLQRATSFADQVADAVDERAATPVADTEPAATALPTPAPRSKPVSQPGNTSAIPTIDQLRLDGTLQLAELHLDIHVYSAQPDDRFVFINMVKHREQSRLAEGPAVREITPDGVILDYQGKTFLLPRE